MDPEYVVRSTVTRTESRLRKAADTVVVLFVSALLVFLLFRFVLVPAQVTNPEVTELKEGELVLVDRISKYVSEYGLGDVLQIKTEDGSRILRLAARGGSTYEVRDGKAYLSGALIDESAYGGSWEGMTGLVASVPEGSFLVLPDNREGIGDLSEYIVPFSGVYGKLRLRIMPVSRISLFS